ncbi:isoprenylcysteine carboxylmethyltransferase family protein [Cellulomonas sp. C5510]|uniref:methyltransferase family protein n=1 Tax=Cellulomonas sp. C5510 TaxID=2871170 RepID=UPI001C98A646|nr:isoprenylcysteine carboxylmethyltransferase family protein [Cellulomonas sp. C5510]QZN87057.1 isoprenylcysteine carboxylmethyltransferase family protein [Cellulomonas sp. C5510]
MPPVLIAAAATGAQLMIAARSDRRPSPSSLLAAALVASASTWLIADSVARFRRSGTTVDPTAPAATSALVTTGANGLTRNPMYVGMAGGLLAHAQARRSWVSLLPVAGFVAAMNRWQIAAEERALAVHFGQAYDHYRAVVPRWVGPRSVHAAISALATPRTFAMKTR